MGPRAALGVRRFRLHSLNWLAEPISAQGTPCAVRVRSTRPPAAATIFSATGGGAEVVLDAPEEGVAPGQACVAYDGTRVLGGGWIARPARAEAAAPAPELAAVG